MQRTDVRPFLQWAGNKTRLLPIIRQHIPAYYDRYYEPFLGSGAVLFDLQPPRFLVSDANGELINLYGIVKSQPKALLREVTRHRNTKCHYHAVREIDRHPTRFSKLSDLQRAARTLYLNRTGYQGLYRVNRQGQFNTPYGYRTGSALPKPDTLLAASRYLNSPGGCVENADFERALAKAHSGSFVYFDPPYDPLSATAHFTAYTPGGFSADDQRRLKRLCDALHQRGCRFLLSNAATPFILDLYQGYAAEVLTVRRSINAAKAGQRQVQELLIRNYS